MLRKILLGVGIAVVLITFGVAWYARAPHDPTLFPEFDSTTVAPPPPKAAAPRVEERSVFFGDLHIHTLLSMDAYLFGVRAGPADAYVYSKGGTIEHGAGYPIRLKEPLDFAAVTDHADYLGMLEASAPDLPLAGDALRRTLLERNRISGTMLFIQTMRNHVTPNTRGAGDPEIMRTAWQRIVTAAEQANDPGVFTAFIGYEWTSMPDSNNLHRNVIYRGSRSPTLPFSSDDSKDPEDLWTALEEQARDGIHAIAIPHNANASNGEMFKEVTMSGAPLDAEYAARRTRWEPLQEIFQVKGASETHPVLSTEDEFANFEIMDHGLKRDRSTVQPQGSYIREALMKGLEYRNQQGFDPFDFGVIGSSDGHGASAPVEEDAFHGKLPLLDGTAGIRMTTSTLLPFDQAPAAQWGSGGLAAIWAEENTRESLFDAMVRKETYATSGTRIRLRFFAGWEYPEDLFDRSDAIRTAYDNGVAMGTTLPPGSGAAPTLAVWALKDPRGANLDRIQIVKLWADQNGDGHEKIFDVAASDQRIPDSITHKVEPVGNTVDVEAATYTDSIGTGELKTVWRDPEWNPSVPARYYARVLEIPTPRWTTFDARDLGIDAPEPTALQERAVSSAITYLP